MTKAGGVMATGAEAGRVWTDAGQPPFVPVLDGKLRHEYEEALPGGDPYGAEFAVTDPATGAIAHIRAGNHFVGCHMWVWTPDGLKSRYTSQYPWEADGSVRHSLTCYAFGLAKREGRLVSYWAGA